MLWCRQTHVCDGGGRGKTGLDYEVNIKAQVEG